MYQMLERVLICHPDLDHARISDFGDYFLYYVSIVLKLGGQSHSLMFSSLPTKYRVWNNGIGRTFSFKLLTLEDGINILSGNQRMMVVLTSFFQSIRNYYEKVPTNKIMF